MVTYLQVQSGMCFPESIVCVCVLNKMSALDCDCGDAFAGQVCLRKENKQTIAKNACHYAPEYRSNIVTMNLCKASSEAMGFCFVTF